MDERIRYERWRHGGWYVNDVRYPSGAVGCVSRNYLDRKWRIVCDVRTSTFAKQQTYPTRKAAADAEVLIAEKEWTTEKCHECVKAALFRYDRTCDESQCVMYSEDGTSGQDRESYTDDQDRDSYEVTA